MTSISASTVDALTLLSWAAYRSDGDATVGENDLATSLVGSGWIIVRPSQLGVSTLDPDNEYFEVHVGNNSGPVAAAFLVERNGVLAIAFRGSDELGDQLATINNQSGYFDAYRNFLDAALLYAADPANDVSQILVTGHSLGGVMAEWFANEYALELSTLELPVSVATFGSPGTNITTAPTALAQSIVHFGHSGDQIFEHQGFVGSLLNGLVREGASIEIDLPNVDANDPRLNFFEHDMFLYQRSAPALASSYFGQRLLDDPASHQIIVDTVISASDDQITLNFSSRAVPLAIIGDSGIHTPGFTDIDIISGGSAGDWIDGGGGNDTLLGGGGNDELFGGTGNDRLVGNIGTDTGDFSSVLSSYTIARTGVLTTVGGPDGLDFLTSVETLQFSDLSLRSLFFTGDFNNDGRSDIVLQNGSSSALWLMNGTAIGAGSGNVGATLGSGWFALGAGDFNGNGTDDLLLQNGQQLALWQMNGVTIAAGSGNIGTLGSGWMVAGVADFTNDARADILLQNGQQLALWAMNGTTIGAGSGNIGTLGSGWMLAGTGDFNGDSRADILLQNGQQLALWQMNGTSIIAGSGNIGTLGSGWMVAGVDDFTNDGRSDILLQNGQQLALWAMNGTLIVPGSSGGIGTLAAGWAVAGNGDFNNDGNADLLLQNGQQIAEWLLIGTAVIDGSGVVGTLATGWDLL